MNVKETELLACPYCKGFLDLVDGGESLVCRSCEKGYKIKSGVPILIYDSEIRA